MRSSLLLVVLLCSLNLPAQINYGRDDCGPTLQEWINKLEEVKSVCRDSVAGDPMTLFNEWVQSAKKDIAEARYKLFRRGPITETRPLVSLLDVIRNNRLISGLWMEAEDFFEYYEALSPREKEIWRTNSYLFNVMWFEEEQKRARANQSSYSELAGVTLTSNTTYFQKALSQLYKYLLDIFEHNRVGELDQVDPAHFEKFSQLLRGVSFVSPPAFDNKAKLNQYLEHFAPSFAYLFGRLMLFDRNEPFFTELTPYIDASGSKRYDDKHFNSIHLARFRSEVENLILQIAEIKKNFCARTNITELGRVKVDMETFPAEQVKANPVIKEPTNEVPEGMARLLVVAKTSKGRLLNSYDHNIFSLYSGDAEPVKIEVNRYVLIPPGNYILKNDKRPYDSLAVSIGVGETKSVDYVPSSSLIVNYRKGTFDDVPIDFRVDFLKQNKENTYKLDTIYYDVIRTKKEMELNPGLYYVRALMPSRFYPPVVPTVVETQANSRTEVVVSGYGKFCPETYNGLGSVKTVRVDVFTRDPEPQTGRRKWLTYINSFDDKGRPDTLFLAPGHYWIEVQYTFSLTREIEIEANQVTREPFENLGSLLVTNGTNSKEYVEVTDVETNTKRQVVNNVAIDVPADRTYHVKVIKTGVKETGNVVVRPRQQTTVRW